MSKISTTNKSIETHILELLISEEVLGCFELNYFQTVTVA